jgi:hypothetical protein
MSIRHARKVIETIFSIHHKLPSIRLLKDWIDGNHVLDGKTKVAISHARKAIEMVFNIH